ncbi:MAG: hypothetical protein R2824_16130 [Saprospiraceae bacterium]
MKEHLQQLLAKGNTKAAIQHLLEFAREQRDADLQEEVLAQSARYQAYAKEKRLGTTSEEHQQIVLARINEALLQIIGELPEENQHNVVNAQGGFGWQWIAGILLLIGVLSGIAKVFVFNVKDPQMGLHLTIYVHGPQNRQDIVLENEGELIADFDDRRDRKLIGQGGQTIFSEIDRRFQDEPFELSMQAEGFELMYPDSTYRFTGEPIYLAVRPDHRLGIVQGKVRSRDGRQFLSEVLIEVAGETDQTDSLGNFYLQLPPEKWAHEYTIYAQKDGYTLKEEKYYPLLGEKSEIRLIPETSVQ